MYQHKSPDKSLYLESNTEAFNGKKNLDSTEMETDIKFNTYLSNTTKDKNNDDQKEPKMRKLKLLGDDFEDNATTKDRSISNANVLDNNDNDNDLNCTEKQENQMSETLDSYTEKIDENDENNKNDNEKNVENIENVENKVMNSVYQYIPKNCYFLQFYTIKIHVKYLNMKMISSLLEPYITLRVKGYDNDMDYSNQVSLQYYDNLTSVNNGNKEKDKKLNKNMKSNLNIFDKFLHFPKKRKTIKSKKTKESNKSLIDLVEPQHTPCGQPFDKSTLLFDTEFDFQLRIPTDANKSKYFIYIYLYKPYKYLTGHQNIYKNINIL